ncbi:MAG: alpha/beta hydrolase [Micrococcales bacterium]|nr:alpha/beta hydrolase [Micrococcales bacterium]
MKDYLSYRDTVLRGTIVSHMGSTIDSLLLHGAGKATRQRGRPIADMLESLGHGSYAFDFVGHGETGGDLEGTTLRMRHEQAEAALSVLNGRCAVVGFSMGGEIAIRIGVQHKFPVILLFYPAIYAAEAYDQPFGSAFSETIRKEGSWMSSDAFQLLSQYEGRVGIVIGSDDKIIPKGVVSELTRSATSAETIVVERVPKGSHLLMNDLIERPEAMARIGRILDLVVS